MANIHDGHRDRLRQLKDKVGIDNLSNIQQLELLLSCVIPRKDTNEIAHRLINKFFNLKNICEASYGELLKVEGVGKRVATFLKFLPNAIEIYNNNQKIQQNELNTLEKEILFFMENIEEPDYENLLVAHLDGSNNLLMLEKTTECNKKRVSIDPKKVMISAIKYSASKVIICHNHPDGTSCPSGNDDTVYKNLTLSLSGLGIELSDSIIIGMNDYYSYRIGRICDYSAFASKMPKRFLPK